VTIGLLSPDARLRTFTNLGVIAPGAKLTTQLSGSSTSYPVYTTAALTTAHPNPVVASASGLLPAIYLGWGIQYRMTLTDSNDVTIWQQDGVGVGGVATQIFDITSYGAVAGGSVDCLAAIQLAIDAAALAAGGVVWFPAGIWRSSGLLHSTTSGVTFAGLGPISELRFDDVAINAGLRLGTPAAATIITANLASNVAIGDRTVTLTAGAGATFATGGWLYCVDADVRHGSFITYIESIATDVLTLQDASPVDLATASTAVASYRPAGALTGVGIKDLRVTCVSSAPSNLQSLIRILNAHAPVVSNVQTSGNTVAGINLDQCDDGLILGCLCENGGAAAGEGVLLSESTNCKVEATTTRHVQFGIDTTQSPKTSIVGCQVHGRTTAGNGRGIKLAHGSNFSTVTGNTIADPTLYGIYLQDSEHCVAAANTILGCGGGAAGTDQHGVQVGGFQDDYCKYNTVADNIISHCSGLGVSVSPTFDTTAKDIYAIVKGNVITNCDTGAIRIFASNRCLVDGNLIRQAPATMTETGAIAVRQATPALTVIRGNVITSLGAALVGIDTSAGDGTSVVLDNVLGPTVTQVMAAGDTVFEPTPTLISTCFETAARFSTTIAGAGTNTFDSNGLVLSAGGGGASSGLAGVAYKLEATGGNSFAGTPRFSVNLGLTIKGSDGQVYVGVSSLSSAAAGFTFTGAHFGFKILWAASGAASVYATQATGGVETVSAALTTVVANDDLELIAQKNGTGSIDYFWRKNGGVLSPATTLTATVPTSGSNHDLQFAVNNTAVASDSSITLRGASFLR
jgi:parallel beta-helix repeat protein